MQKFSKYLSSKRGAEEAIVHAGYIKTITHSNFDAAITWMKQTCTSLFEINFKYDFLSV